MSNRPDKSIAPKTRLAHSIVVAIGTWFQPQATQELSHLVNGILRHVDRLLFGWIRLAIDEIILEAMADPIECEEIVALVDAISYAGSEIKVREEELEGFGLA